MYPCLRVLPDPPSSTLLTAAARGAHTWHLQTADDVSENGNAVRVIAKRRREERNYTSERTDESLLELPAKLMADIDKLCYSVLVKLCSSS